MTSEQKLIRRMKNRKAQIIASAIGASIQVPIFIYAGIKFQQGMDIIDQQLADPQSPTLNTAQMAKLTLAMTDLSIKGVFCVVMFSLLVGVLLLAIFDHRNRIIIANYEKIAELEQRLNALTANVPPSAPSP